MIGSPASAVPGAMPARMAAPRAAARWRARMGGATVAPESWCDADMPTKVQVQAWLDAYVAAWRSYERDAIVTLFTDDVSYRYLPFDEPLRGAEAVADSWLAEPRRARHVGGGVRAGADRRPGGDRHRRDALHRRRGVLEPVAARVRARRALLALRRVVRPAHGGLAGGQGFEPRYPAPKTGVLPLDDPPGRGRYYDAPVTAPTVLILAAGEGTRMRSAVPKVLHPLCGRTMIEWPIAAAREAGAGRIVVVDGPKRALADALPEDVEVAIQEEPNGTGDAVRSAADQIDAGTTVLVLYGDVPLITADAITALARAHEESGAAATMATMELEDPSGYGRVVRDAEGGVERVVETKTPGDATPEEEAIREVNTGIYAFAGGDLLRGAEGAARRQRAGRALPARRAAAAARRGQGDRRARGHRRGAHARRQHARRARAGAAARPGADPPRPRARGRHDRRPRQHADRGRRRDRPRHDRRAERRSCAAPRGSARAARSGR